MPLNQQKLIVIVGPTASGKSELAVRLAKKFGGEIISADSRQVYRGLDIGTGKVLGKWIKSNVAVITRSLDSYNIFIYKGIPHHCIDFVSPKRTFTVAEYKKCADTAIKDIASRGKIPILVGGTGFWIDTVVYDLNFPGVPPNLKLRKRLEKKSATALLKILQKLDPERAKTIEQKNPRRLIRAIEIVKALGQVPTIKKKSPYNILWLGTKIPEQKLKLRIHKRLLKRMREGIVQEAKRLKRKGLPWKRFYELGLEYRYLADYLRGQISKQEMLQGLERAINDYSRRQMVWFKKNKKIHWLPRTAKAEGLTKFFLSREPL